MTTEIDHDANGNKIVRVRLGKKTRAFSIQTLGNLPITHRNGADLLEIRNWIRDHGTAGQKEKLKKHLDAGQTQL